MKIFTMKACTTLVMVLLSIITVSGQIQYENIRFKHLNNNDGLPHNTIYSITSDNNGFIWFGTRNGLCRFDGYSIKIFSHSDSDTNSVCHDFINGLYNDKEGNQLWISTYHGICSYNYSLEQFKDYYIKGNTSEKINFIRTSNNDFLITCSNGIFQYDKINDSFIPYIPEKISRSVKNLAEDACGTLWIECGDELIRYSPESEEIEPLPKKISPYSDNCRDIIFLTPEQFVFNTENGFYIYHIQSDILHMLSENLKVKSFRCATTDHTGNIWVGTECGIYVFNKRYNLIAHYEQSENDLSALNDSPVYSLYKDIDDNMWVGTYFGGVNYYINGTDKFKTYPYGGAQNHLSGKAVRQIINSRDNGLYISTEDGGLNYLNDRKEIIRAEYMHKHMHIDAKNIHSLYLDNDNSLWIGLFLQGILHYDPRTKSTTEYHHNVVKESSGFCMLKDNDGKLWYGGPEGLFVIDRANSSYELISPSRFFTMMEYNDSIIWVGSRREGLWKINTLNKELSPLKILPHDNVFISYLYQDSQENIWIGTEDNGVFISDRHGNIIKTYDKSDLMSNTIKGIIEDDMHNIWISTGDGLCNINHKSNKIERYTIEDGLPVNQFNYNSVCSKPDGELYFGTIDGMISFYPKMIHSSSPRFDIIITGIWSNNEELSPRNGNAYIQSSVSDITKLTLSYNQAKSIRIEYSGLNYQFCENTKYAMMMEGIDDEWQFVNNQHQVRFSNLSPGKYILRIKGSKNGIDWDVKGQKEVEIHILPPWWLSKAAIITYILLFISICILVYRYTKIRITLKMQLKTEQEQRINTEILNKQKISFFTYVSHDLKTPLTLILSPLKRLITQNHISDEDIDKLETIYRNANRMNYLINELLTFSKIEMKQKNITVQKGNAMHFIKELASIFNETAENCEIDFIVELNEVSQNVWFSPSNLERILYNLLSNAFKYTYTGGYVKLKADFIQEQEETFLQISVKDNGRGIPKESHKHIFESYYQVDTNDYHEGFGLGLALTKSLINLHKGTIDLISEVGQGSEFIIKLNVSESAYSEEEKNYENVNNDDINRYNQRLKDTLELIPDQNNTVNDSQKDILMIVEDNREMNNYIADIFKDKYEIIQTYNGREALKTIATKRPDLIISDVMMPLMDGLELTRHIKNDIQTSHIPVILLTAKGNEEDFTEGFLHGADSYITKPFSSKNLELMIYNLQENRRKSFLHFKQMEECDIKSIVKNSKDEDFMQQLVDYIMKNIDKEDLSVSEIIKHLGISRSLLQTKMKNITGVSITRFIRTIKMKEAKKCLMNKMNVSEASYAVGIYDPNYFTKCFKKEFGITPSEYLKGKHPVSNVIEL